MTMALSADPRRPRMMTLAQWDALGETEERYELVRGVLIMAPSELWGNRHLVVRLGAAFANASGAYVGADMDLLIGPGPLDPTVRRPDLLIVSRWPGAEASRIDPNDVLLVAEIVSPSSQEQDWVTKRDEYAAAGIPAYLVVDRHRGQVALFSRPEDGRYIECTVGTALDVPFLGATVRVDLADLLAVPAAGADPQEPGRAL